MFANGNFIISNIHTRNWIEGVVCDHVLSVRHRTINVINHSIASYKTVIGKSKDTVLNGRARGIESFWSTRKDEGI